MMEVQRADKKEKREEEEEAALTSPDTSVPRTPRRALRGRGTTRANSAAPSPDTNGTPSAAGSGRVLRDRSMRSVPVWRRRDLGVEQDDDGDEEEEEEEEAEARRRRKTACPRRRRNTEAGRDSSRAQYGTMSYMHTSHLLTGDTGS